MARTNPYILFRVLTASFLFAGTMFLTAGATPASDAPSSLPTVSASVPVVEVPASPVVASAAPVVPTAVAQTGTKEPTDIEVDVVGSIAEVDRCEGLTLWSETLPHEPQVIAAHDLCDAVKPWDESAIGGWKTYGHVQSGDPVRIHGSAAGLRSGDYRATERVVVPTGTDYETALSSFTTQPAVILQTCIPNTRTTLLIGLDQI